jgi:hypothetical protein
MPAHGHRQVRHFHRRPGVVRVTPLAGGTADVFIDAGVVFPLRVSRVWATGTTATGICGLS